MTAFMAVLYRNNSKINKRLKKVKKSQKKTVYNSTIHHNTALQAVNRTAQYSSKQNITEYYNTLYVNLIVLEQKTK